MHRNNLSDCSPQQLYKNTTVLNLYNNIKNISKIPVKNCNININGFSFKNYNERGYCIIMRTESI